MSQVYKDIVKGKYFIKKDGVVEEASLSKRPLENDQVVVNTELENAQEAFNECLSKLQYSIQDLKEKAELKKLDIEIGLYKKAVDDSEYEAKVQSYIDAKSAYNTAKANLESLQNA